VREAPRPLPLLAVLSVRATSKPPKGTVAVVQRVSSDSRLNSHLHAIVIDDAFAAHNDSVVFHPLKSFIDSDVADLLQVIRVRVVNFWCEGESLKVAMS